jgi:hypothetical protein
MYMFNYLINTRQYYTHGQEEKLLHMTSVNFKIKKNCVIKK